MSAFDPETAREKARKRGLEFINRGGYRSGLFVRATQKTAQGEYPIVPVLPQTYNFGLILAHAAPGWVSNAEAMAAIGSTVKPDSRKGLSASRILAVISWRFRTCLRELEVNQQVSTLKRYGSRLHAPGEPPPGSEKILCMGIGLDSLNRTLEHQDHRCSTDLSPQICHLAEIFFREGGAPASRLFEALGAKDDVNLRVHLSVLRRKLEAVGAPFTVVSNRINGKMRWAIAPHSEMPPRRSKPRLAKANPG